MRMAGLYLTTEHPRASVQEEGHQDKRALQMVREKLLRFQQHGHENTALCEQDALKAVIKAGEVDGKKIGGRSAILEDVQQDGECVSSTFFKPGTGMVMG